MDKAGVMQWVLGKAREVNDTCRAEETNFILTVTDYRVYITYLIHCAFEEGIVQVELFKILLLLQIFPHSLFNISV